VVTSWRLFSWRLFFGQAEPVPDPFVPAPAATQTFAHKRAVGKNWIPACAGMNAGSESALPSADPERKGILAQHAKR
jgi:hypothetical protein